MNTFSKTLTAAALVTVSGIAVAADEISANVSLATDYIWRGVSQTNQKPAISGGFDYSHDFSDSISWYLGTWGGTGGKLWWDDLVIEEMGLVNVLRRGLIEFLRKRR